MDLGPAAVAAVCLSSWPASCWCSAAVCGCSASRIVATAGFGAGKASRLRHSFFKRRSPMRALCGAIITAGALIGLGLTALGWGVRFQSMDKVNPDTHAQIGAYSLTYLFAIIFAGMLIGI